MSAVKKNGCKNHRIILENYIKKIHNIKLELMTWKKTWKTCRKGKLISMHQKVYQQEGSFPAGFPF